ncbi:MAG: hypothetical protein JWP10_398 [Nocardioidaceae bacterium]|nr:hypothetical protein [Nocardioidaceae bacterium]
MSANDEARRRGLRQMRTLASSLLVIAAVVFFLTQGETGFLGYVNAGAEASMVGAIADWFAVTALFRHPLGLPIPHTALIPNRKQALGESLQEFVADNFLNEDVVRDRIRTAHVSRTVGEWLVDERHSERVVREGARIVTDGLAHIKQSDVSTVIQDAIMPRLAAEPLSPVVGQLLAEIVEDNTHHALVDLALDELHRWLEHNESAISALVGERAPWWTPNWLDERMGSRLHQEALAWVQDIRKQPDHHARQALDTLLRQLAQDLQHDSSTMERFERLKVRVLEQPQLAMTSIALWDSLRKALIAALQDEQGHLRKRALDEVRSFAQRLIDDEVLAERIDALVSDIAAYVVNNYGRELATIISETVNRWDGKETAERIELHVGRDLQFIRINGTVVGGLAGIVIHAFATLT